MQNIKKKLNDVKSSLFAGFAGVNVQYGNGWDSIDGIMGKMGEVLQFLISASGVVAVIIVVYGAYLFITSAGDDQKVEQGNAMITGGIIGMVIVFLSRLLFEWYVKSVIQGQPVI